MVCSHLQCKYKKPNRVSHFNPTEIALTAFSLNQWFRTFSTRVTKLSVALSDVLSIPIWAYTFKEMDEHCFYLTVTSIHGFISVYQRCPLRLRICRDDFLKNSVWYRKLFVFRLSLWTLLYNKIISNSSMYSKLIKFDNFFLFIYF